jgi:putative hemolysin
MPTATAFLARAVALTPIGRAYARAVAGPSTVEFSTRALRELDVAIAVATEELANIPASGPLVVVANHPFGAVDGLLLLELIARVRSDAKLVGNGLLRHIRPLRDRLLLVDVFDRQASTVRRNGSALRAAVRWLERGGCLALFPAGEVAHTVANRRVIDSAWQDTAAALALRTGATVVPVFIPGENSRMFRAAGRVHPLLRTALLPREMWAKRHSTIEIRVGTPIVPDVLAAQADSSTRTALLRSRVDNLRNNGGCETQDVPGGSEAYPVAIAPRGMAAAIDANIDALRDHMLLESGAFQVFCARSEDLPAVLPEIGRLRELTFRQVGEGTGLSRDLDRFDETYRHLFVWDRVRGEIAGAYRIGATDELTARAGVEGLYTRTLFDFDPTLLAQIGPALELGRSFVQPDYQRDFSPLMLLWKGISRLVVLEPRYRRLFGVVSISDRYASTSRRLLVRFLQTTRFDRDLGRLVRAKNPPAPPGSGIVETTTVERIEDVSALVRSIEPDGKDIPVLLRQYLKLNAKLLGFSLDPSFGNVLDGLVVVDLAEVAPAILARFMGRDESRAFLDSVSGRPLAQPDEVPAVEAGVYARLPPSPLEASAR